MKAAGTFWGEYFLRGSPHLTRASPAGEKSRRRQRSPIAPSPASSANSTICWSARDPSRIEFLWHKTFRSFTYTGSRGATTNVISGIDIALWDILGKVLGKPDLRAVFGGEVRDDILLYTHPNGRNMATDEGVVEEIRAIVASGHTALKFDPFPLHQNRIGAADDIYLGGGMSKQGRGDRRATHSPGCANSPDRTWKSSSTRTAASTCRRRSACAGAWRTPARSISVREGTGCAGRELSRTASGA